MKIYIASAYGRRNCQPDELIDQNVWRAIEAARELILMGHIPYVPHLNHFIHHGWSGSPSEEEWLNICSIWIPHCHAVLRLDGESVGADNEVAYAKALGIKVFYSIKELCSDCEEGK